MIFAHLRTSINYDVNTVRRVGGSNGYGQKLAFIWSQHGSIETVDVSRGLKYTQRFLENLSIVEKPTITKVKTTKWYTRVSFMPDLGFNIYRLIWYRCIDRQHVKSKNHIQKIGWISKEFSLDQPELELVQLELDQLELDFVQKVADVRTLQW
jgi:hypothetical protein